jgi:hypothetical protein
MITHFSNRKHNILCFFFILVVSTVMTMLLPLHIALGIIATMVIMIIFHKINPVQIAGYFSFAVMAILLPMESFATTPTAAATGFGAVAWEIYDALDGGLGLTIGLVGGGLALGSMVRGMNSLGIASGSGIAVGSQIAPDLIVALNGGLLLP